MKKTILSILLSLVAFGADAASYFIDYDSGSDSSTGTSTATAWKYFPLDSRASGTSDAKSPAAGDVFIFKGGTVYYMPTNLTAFDLTTSGTAGNYIVLDGDSGKYASRWGSGTNRAVLDGNDVTTLFVDGTARSYWKVNGFEMRNGGYGTSGVVINNGGAWEVTDNYIHDFYDWDLESGANKLGSYIRSVGTGIRIDDAAEVLVMGNEVTKVGGVGIGIGYPVTNIVVSTNYIHDYIVWFIDISTFSTYSSSNILVRDNLLKNLFHYSQSYWYGAITDEKLNYSIEENPHEDGIFVRQPGSSGSIQNLQIFNNTFVNDVKVTENGGTAWLFTSEIRAGSSIYIYNNLFQNAYANDHIALGWNQNDDYSIKVYHNTFAGVGNCIQITEYTTNTTHTWHVLNNIFDTGVGLGPGLSSVGTCATLYGALTSDYNLFSNQGTLGYAVSGAGCNYQNTLAQWQAASSDDANSITGSAGFVSLVLDALSSTSNLRLASSSDAIGAGLVLDPAIYPGADYDRLGRYRGTTGAATDLGAFVYNEADSAGPTIFTNNASGARVSGFRNIAMAVLPIIPHNHPATPLLFENFEGSGYATAGWAEHLAGTGNSINEDNTTNVLSGSQSLALVGIADDPSFATNSFTASSTVYGYFQFQCLKYPNEIEDRFRQLLALQTASGTAVFRIRQADAGGLYIETGGTSDVALIGALTLGQTYHIWWSWTKDNGSNSAATLSVSTDKNKPTSGDGFVSITGTQIATDASVIMLGYPNNSEEGANFYGSPSWIYDYLLLDDAEILSYP